MPRATLTALAMFALIPTAMADDRPIILKPARVFDGTQTRAGWAVIVRGDRIAATGKGVIPGPRLLCTTRAIVATGSYAPKLAPELTLPQGAEEADAATLVRVVRDQIGRGADWVKVYADYRWGPTGRAGPTFSVD